MVSFGNKANTQIRDIIIDREESIKLFEILGALGYSFEEIQIQRQFGYWHSLIHGEKIIKNSFQGVPGMDRVVYQLTGSRCEGLAGNIFLKNMGTDTDYTFFNFNRDLRDGNNINSETYITCLEDTRLSANSQSNYSQCLFMEDDISYPGYVKLFELKSGGKQYMKRIHSKEMYYYHFKDTGFNFPYTECNGPAFTARHQNNDSRDIVYCYIYKGWPKVANEWLSRKRPNNWPTEDDVNNIKYQGCLVSAVGHFDHQDENNLQWRISFSQEMFLISRLNYTQSLCYAIMKWILKLSLKKVANDAITSFHVKHSIFWLAENSSCQWNPQTLLHCIKECIRQFIICVKNRKLSHFFIKQRNLFNSKLTDSISKEVCTLLNKYEENIELIFRLSIRDDIIFRQLFCLTSNHDDIILFYQNVSIIGSCFRVLAQTLDRKEALRTIIFNSRVPQSVDKMLRYVRQIFKIISQYKCIIAAPSISLLESLIGMLSFARFKENGEHKFEIIAEDYFGRHKKESRCISSVLLRCVVFLFMREKYSDSLDTCSKHVFHEYKLLRHLLSINCTPDWEEYKEDKIASILMKSTIFNEGNSMKESALLATSFKEQIVNRFKCSRYSDSSSHPASEIIDDLESVPKLFDTWGVCFVKAEKWVMPDVLLFEILCVKNVLVLSTILCELLMKCLCNIKLNKAQGIIDNIWQMDKYVDKRCLDLLKDFKDENARTFVTDDLSFEDLYRAYNIVAYCNLKAGNYEKASEYILKSLQSFPSSKNTAYGYLRFIILLFIEKGY